MKKKIKEEKVKLIKLKEKKNENGIKVYNRCD